MKINKLLAIVLVIALALSFAACGTPENKPTTSPSTAPTAETPVTFQWDNFEGRDPAVQPATAPNGASLWWNNWANLRASAENGVIQIQFQPLAFDPDGIYADEAAYYAGAADWMGNWGEAIDMWSLEGIQFCKYLTIRIKGEAGGEEKKILMDWHPEDTKYYSARFSDLVLKDGSHPVITTEWQDIVIDLEKSGFPGMTNALHIRAFAECTISLDELYFSEGVGPIDATSKETILAGLTAPETGKPADLPIKDFVSEAVVKFSWDNFEGRDPAVQPATAPNGASLWWNNWANLTASAADGVIQINYKPLAFDPDGIYADEAAYYSGAGDWMGNWGEAIDMWRLEGIQFCKYLTIRIKGEAGGEENKLIMDWHPEDTKYYSARFSDLVLKDGSHPVITTEWQDIVIDLAASGFPGMTNALHIRAFAECTISLDELYFSEGVGPIDITDAATITAGMTAPETGKPAGLPIKDFVAALK